MFSPVSGRFRKQDAQDAAPSAAASSAADVLYRRPRGKKAEVGAPIAATLVKMEAVSSPSPPLQATTSAISVATTVIVPPAANIDSRLVNDHASFAEPHTQEDKIIENEEAKIENPEDQIETIPDADVEEEEVEPFRGPKRRGHHHRSDKSDHFRHQRFSNGVMVLGGAPQTAGYDEFTKDSSGKITKLTLTEDS